MGALLPLNDNVVDVVDVGLVLREVAILLRLVVAVGALVPLYANVVLEGLVLRDLAVRLGPVVAMGALLPLYADVVLVGLVLRYLAVRLGPVFAALVVTEPPAHIYSVHHGSVRLKVVLLLRLVLAPELSASMPSDADGMHVGSVFLDAALLLRLVRALCTGHSCQVTPTSCTSALCCLMCCFAFVLYSLPSSGQ